MAKVDTARALSMFPIRAGPKKEIIGHISFKISHLSFRKASRRFSQIYTDQTEKPKRNNFRQSIILICLYLRKSAAGFPK